MSLKYIVFIFVLMLAYVPIAIGVESNNSTVFATGNQASWIALAILITAVSTAWFMNCSTPKMRAFGTFLAALECFAMVIWFENVLATGIIENPKPSQTPMDSAKPTLLWIQAGVALVAGLVLFITAFKQSQGSEAITLTAKNEPERYGLVSRMIHWTTAILFISLIPMGIFTSMIPEDAWFRNHYYIIHKSIGVTVFILFFLRVFWNRRSRRPELDVSLKPAERRWAHRAHIALYVMMISIPVTGYFMTSYHGFPTYFFAWELQPFWGQSQAYLFWGVFHKYILQYLVYIILGAHIVGALKHHFIDKHASAFKRMVS
jgi:cytochrome b561